MPGGDTVPPGRRWCAESRGEAAAFSRAKPGERLKVFLAPDAHSIAERSRRREEISGSSGDSCSACVPAMFDVANSASRCLLQQETLAATQERANLPMIIAASFIGFFLLELVLWLALPQVLPRNASREARVKIREAMVSSVHDLISVPIVFGLLHHISHSCDSPAGILGIGPLAFVPARHIDSAGSVLAGFLLWNSIHYIWHCDVHANGLVSNLVHHAAFLAMIALNADTFWCNWAFAPLYMGEWSTFFLNARVICKLLGRKELAVSALFALLFFFTRVVVFGALAAHFIAQASELRLLLPIGGQVSYLVLLPALYGLNLFWFWKICVGVMRTFNGEGGRENSSKATGELRDERVELTPATSSALRRVKRA